jgi:TonB family protein
MNKIFKNRNDFRQIIAFIQEKLPVVERREVEDALKHDAFLREAKEGLSAIEVSDLIYDIADLDSVLGNKKKHISSTYLYVIIIAVLIVLSVFLYKKFSSKQPLEIIEPEMSFDEEVIVDSLFYESEYKISEIKSESSIIPEAALESDEKNNADDTKEETIVQKTIDKRDVSKPESSTLESEKPIIEVDIADKTDAGQTDTAFQRIEKEIEISKKALLPENIESHIMDENDLGLAINEVSPAETELLSPDYSAKATPEGGFSKFDEYIYENMEYPETEERQRRQVLRVSFVVGVNGELSDFSVLKAPNNEDFAKEAIRLIKEGPQWTPAFDNGISVEEKVTVRIVFRP